MARVKVVKKARKDQGKCGRCGEEIKAGMPYRHWSFRYGGTRKRCMKAECFPKMSDLTNNEKLATFYAAVESLESARGGDKDDLASAID